MEKEIRIGIPEGYEIDEEKSDFECIKFKKIEDEFEYVDLGLPSGTLWATCNVGAKKPEELGEYFKLQQYDSYNCPTSENINELIWECNWVWCSINSVNGYMVIGKNGNHIFLPTKDYQTCIGDFSYIGRYLSSAVIKDYYIPKHSSSIKYHNCGNITLNLVNESRIVNTSKYEGTGYEFLIRTIKNK